MKRIKRLFNVIFSSKRKLAIRLKTLLGFAPANLSIFLLAFKHSSKSPTAHTSNERLEYLGDAILDAIISDYLFKKYPLRGEGFLTEMRSKIVNRKRLGHIGDKLNLKEFLDYDAAYVTVNNTILGNALEALLGAIYLDAGYEKTKEFVFNRILTPYIDLDNLQNVDLNFKSKLFEWAQKYDKKLEFKVQNEKMVNKYKLFVVGAYVDDVLMGVGDGRSKKAAQKEAAKEAYQKLNLKAQEDKDNHNR